MAKNKNIIIHTSEQGQVTPVELAEAVKERYIRYAYTSLEDRALPDARDGLKPSQRRILVAMNDLGLRPGGSNKKSAKICGDTSGNYHPHGEAVIYPTMVRLIQDWVMGCPLGLGQGNFGNRDGDPPAAMRYTEARLSHFGLAMLEDLSPDVVGYIPTYNDESTEPIVLPAKLPNLLVNGCAGIAVGWATDMPPHNLREVVACIEAYIKKPTITAAELIKLMPGPDFPTGGKLLGQDGVLEYYSTGRGSLLTEGVYRIDTGKNGKQSIVITELPYGVGPADLAADIEKMFEDPKHTFDEIDDFKDLSKENINIVIGVTKGANAQLAVSKLLKSTCLRRKISVNQTVLINGKVVDNTSLVQLLKAFVEHRKDVLTKKYNAELIRSQERVHILDGLIAVSSKIDEAIKIIRAADGPAEAAQALIESKIVSSEAQAKAVLAITLAKLTKLEASALASERKDLIERIAWLKKILASVSEIENLVIEEQRELAKKLGVDRRTQITGMGTQIANEDLIKDEQMVISLTGDGYVRSTPADHYRLQGRGGKGVNSTSKKEDGESVFEMFESGSKDLVLFFTNLGLVYQKKAYEIPQVGKTGKGTHVSNLLSLSEGETVTNMISLKTVDQDGYLVIVTRHGLIKRSEIREYDTSLRLKGLTGIRLNEGDQVAFALATDGTKDIFIVTANGSCVRYSEQIVPVQGRATQGSRAMKLDADDTVAQVLTLEPKDQPDILVVTTGGLGKKTSASEYRSLTSRQVKGYSVIDRHHLVKKKESIAGACSITENSSILILTSRGKAIRIGSTDIRSTGRTTKGVTVVKMDEGDTVVRIARMSEANSENEEEPSETLQAV